MVASGKSQVFWLRYKPARDESFERFMELAGDALPAMLGFYVVEHVRSGDRRMDILFCVKSRNQESRMRNPHIWKRKRAQGSVEGTERRCSGESLDTFVQRMARNMSVNRCIHTAGSPEAVVRGLTDSRQVVNTRVREYRGSR